MLLCQAARALAAAAAVFWLWWGVLLASSLLGRPLLPERLAERGLPLILAGRDEARLEEVRRRIQRRAPGSDVELVVGDLASRTGLEDLIAALSGRVIDVLVNNAGFGTYGPFSEIDAGREHELAAVNVDAVVRLTHAVLPGMLERGRGGILNVASTIASPLNGIGISSRSGRSPCSGTSRPPPWPR